MSGIGFVTSLHYPADSLTPIPFRLELETAGIPFLERFETFGAVADHLKKVRGWQAKNPLALIYRAFAEWKNGDGDGALDTLTAVKGKAWEAKAAAVREMIINTPTPDSPPSTPRG
jgi:hypothetical protein